ncbi:MAG: class I SAM-dependent methyltransferase [Victivallales bacterium]|nr:class I SAM-dependent methyltransferase [Victivallales bacterium]
MLFLTKNEIESWRKMGEEILRDKLTPNNFNNLNLNEFHLPIFRFYAGCMLAANKLEELAKPWLSLGAIEESENLMTNAFLAAFLERQNGNFIMPAVVFEDPAPYIHFGTIPAIKTSRENLIAHSSDSLPSFSKPISYVDIGCGDGSLTIDLLTHWRDAGVFSEIKEILLVDASSAMLEKAQETLSESFPKNIINVLNDRIENVSDQITGHYDIALSSLAYHHLTWENKVTHMRKLKNHFDHILIFDLDANNDIPELGSPELAVSVYQSYGRLINNVFEHDAPVKTAQLCVDSFLMVELVSLMSEIRGTRNDYHMLRYQWHQLFQSTLGSEFTLLADTTPYADEFLDLFFVHYGK